MNQEWVKILSILTQNEPEMNPKMILTTRAQNLYSIKMSTIQWAKSFAFFHLQIHQEKRLACTVKIKLVRRDGHANVCYPMTMWFPNEKRKLYLWLPPTKKTSHDFLLMHLSLRSYFCCIGVCQIAVAQTFPGTHSQKQSVFGHLGLSFFLEKRPKNETKKCQKLG